MPARRRLAIIAILLALPLTALFALLAPPGTLRDVALSASVGVAALGAGILAASEPEATGAVGAPRGTVRRILATLGTTALLGAALALAVLWLRSDGGIAWTRGTIAQFAIVAFFSGAVGFGELIARYRDDPARLLGARPTAAYLCVNLAAGIVALALVKQFGVFPASPNQAVYEALLASFGAIAFFRTSLFTARIGDTDVGIGPSTLLKTLLESSDRLVNRAQAEERAERVSLCMDGIDFDKAKATLPTLCLGLVEGLTEDEQKLLAEQIAKLDRDAAIHPDAKAAILGVYLLRQVGGTVLSRAVTTLGATIRR